MLSLIEQLPVELVGTYILAFLRIYDIVRLDRACGSMRFLQVFYEPISYHPSVELPSNIRLNNLTFKWFAKRQFKIKLITVYIPFENPCLHVKNLNVDKSHLWLQDNIMMEDCTLFLNSNVSHYVNQIEVFCNQDKEVMQQISLCTRNVTTLLIYESKIIHDWPSVDILSRWKLKEITLHGTVASVSLTTLIVQSCRELICIKLYSSIVVDAALIAIAQHCPKLETLQLLNTCKLTYNSLIALSERGLPLDELEIVPIPIMPTVDIARLCNHALSCIHHLRTYHLNENAQEVTILIPYMTGLTSVYLEYYYLYKKYIPLLTQYCHKLTKIQVCTRNCHIDYNLILSLCCANLLLQELSINVQCDITDTALIELIHACPHLHTLSLPYETEITDIGVLALSEQCTQLRQLTLCNCDKVTEPAVLQLLQRCRKLTKLKVSNSSLSEETWTQLDRYTQKRVHIH